MKNLKKQAGTIALAALAITILFISIGSCKNSVSPGTGDTFTVTYHANGESIAVPAPQKAAAGSRIIIAALEGYDPVTAGKNFDYWNTSANGSGDIYSAGYELTVVKDMNLYAQWSVPGEAAGTTGISYTMEYSEETVPLVGGITGYLWFLVCAPEWQTYRRIEDGQAYSVAYSLTSDAALALLNVGLADAYELTGGYWPLSGNRILVQEITPAKTRIDGTTSIVATAVSPYTTTGTSPNSTEMANCLHFSAVTLEKEAPTLTFETLTIKKSETITLVSVTQNGSPGNATTQLALTFDKPVELPNPAAVRLNSTVVVYKQPLESALSGSGTNWILNVDATSNYTSSFNLEVYVEYYGYTFTGKHNVTVFTGFIPAPPTPKVTIVTFNANGNAGQSTTQVNFISTSQISGLISSNIFLGGVPGVTIQSLSSTDLGDGRWRYTLGITGFKTGGTLTLAVSRPYYDISIHDQARTTTIYYDYKDTTYDLFLGRGYDILNSPYYQSSYAKPYALNMPKLKSEGKVSVNRLNFRESHSMYVTGESLYEYSRDLSVKTKASAGAGLFGASVRVNFNIHSSVAEYESFATCNAELIKEHHTLLPISLNDIQEKYLDYDFQHNYLNNFTVSPEELFTFYGTHIMIKTSLGGRLDMSYVYHNHSNEIKTSIETKIKASYAVVSGSVDVKEQTTASEFRSDSSELVHSYGGGLGYDLTSFAMARTNYANWANTIETTDKLALVKAGDINNVMEMIPIWMLVDTNAPGGMARRDAIVNEYNRQLTANGNLILGLQPAGGTNVLDVFTSAHNNSTLARANLLAQSPQTMYEIGGNVNHGVNVINVPWLYMGYIKTPSEAQSIRDIKIFQAVRSNNEPELTKIINGKTYYRRGGDLLQGCNSGYWSWLYITKDPSAGAPIKNLYLEIDGELAGREGTGWSRVVFTSGEWANLNYPAWTWDSKRTGSVIYLQVQR